MSRTTETVGVRILDKEYQVACPPDQQAELLLSAKHLDQQMRGIRETGKVIGLERIAVMAALNISHELLQSRRAAAPDQAQDSASKRSSTTGENSGENSGENKADRKSFAALNAKLDEALHQLRQIEIG